MLRVRVEGVLCHVDDEGPPLVIKENTVKAGGGEYTYKKLHSLEDGDVQIHESTTLPLTRAFVDGYNTSLLLLGETGSGKQNLFGGAKNGKNGLMAHTIDSLYAELESKQADKPAVTVQFWEMYNENFVDLLDPENAAVDVEFDPDRGPQVGGLTSREAQDASQCKTLFRLGLAARNQGTTEFGPISSRAFLGFEMTLTIGATRCVHRTVVMAGAELLSVSPERLRLREGPTSTLSMIEFGKLVSVLTRKEGDKSLPGYVDYRGSKIRHLAHDILGGNCRTTVLIMLKTIQTESTTEILQMSRDLSGIVNFPAVNTINLQYIQRRFRHRIIHLEDRVQSLKPVGDEDKGAQGVMKLHHLEGRLNEVNLEKLRLTEENERIYAKLVDLRKAYNDLGGEKAALSKELIKSEEERLNIAKNLVDLRIENNKVTEQAEEKTHEQMNKALSLENDTLELQMRNEKIEKQYAELKEKCEQLELDRRELQDEYVALKTNFLSTNRDYDKERARGEELGLELLNVVNARVVLQKEKDMYETEVEKLRAKLDGLQEQIASAESISHQAKTEQEILQSQLNKASGDLETKKIELGQKILGLENQKIELEKQQLQMSKLREVDITELKRRNQQELNRVQEHAEALQKDNLALKKQTKRDQRKAQELAAEIAEQTKITCALEEQLAQNMKTHGDFVEEYRERLRKYINDIAEFMSRADGKSAAARAGMHGHLKKYVDTMMKEITSTYAQRERQLAQAVNSQISRQREASTALSRTKVALRTIKDRVESQGIDVDDLLTAQNVADLEVAGTDSSVPVLPSITSTVSPQAPPDPKEVHNWQNIRKQMRDIMTANQTKLEKERAKLLARCTKAEAQLKAKEHYIETTVKPLQRQLKKLQAGTGATSRAQSRERPPLSMNPRSRSHSRGSSRQDDTSENGRKRSIY